MSYHVSHIMALLPKRDNCGKCGYAACDQYAEALAIGETSVDTCPLVTDESRSAIHRILTVDRSMVEAYGARAASKVIRVLKEVALAPARVSGLLFALFPLFAVVWVLILAIAMM